MFVGCGGGWLGATRDRALAVLVTATLSSASASAQVVHCRIQFPEIANVAAGGDAFQVFGRVYMPGITDQSSFNDPDPSVIAQVGVGPNGSNPTVSLSGWLFHNASPNPLYGGPGGEANLDEYLSNVVSPNAAGSYDYAFRFSSNFGASFSYCDGATTGSSDGYQVANAGDLTVTSSGPAPVPALSLPAVVLLVATLLGVGFLSAPIRTRR